MTQVPLAENSGTAGVGEGESSGTGLGSIRLDAAWHAARISRRERTEYLFNIPFSVLRIGEEKQPSKKKFPEGLLSSKRVSVSRVLYDSKLS